MPVSCCKIYQSPSKMVWRQLVIIVLMMTTKMMGIKVNYKELHFGKIGDKMRINCFTDEQPEFCTFFRPDDLEICQPRSLYEDKIDKNCIYEKSAKIEVGENECSILVPQVTSSHLGVWRCKAYSWGDWGEDTIRVDINNNNNNNNNDNNNNNKEEKDWGEGKLLKQEKKTLTQVKNYIQDNIRQEVKAFEVTKENTNNKDDNSRDNWTNDEDMGVEIKDMIKEDEVDDVKVSGRMIREQKQEASVELVDIWGEADLEAGKPQSFSCELQSSQTLKNLRWFLIKGEEIAELGSPSMNVVDDEEPVIYMSTIIFTPQIKHNGYSLTCRSVEADEEDHFKMNVFALTANESFPRTFSVEEGKDLELSIRFSSFPAPQEGNIEWTIGTSTNPITLQPGKVSNDGKYSATNLATITNENDSNNTISMNQMNISYRLTLQIKNVDADEMNKNHFVEINNLHKKVKIPIKVEVTKRMNNPEESSKSPMDLVEDIDVWEETNNEKESVNFKYKNKDANKDNRDNINIEEEQDWGEGKLLREEKKTVTQVNNAPQNNIYIEEEQDWGEGKLLREEKKTATQIKNDPQNNIRNEYAKLSEGVTTTSKDIIKEKLSVTEYFIKSNILTHLSLNYTDNEDVNEIIKSTTDTEYSINSNHNGEHSIDSSENGENSQNYEKVTVNSGLTESIPHTNTDNAGITNSILDVSIENQFENPEPRVTTLLNGKSDSQFKDKRTTVINLLENTEEISDRKDKNIMVENNKDTNAENSQEYEKETFTKSVTDIDIEYAIVTNSDLEDNVESQFENDELHITSFISYKSDIKGTTISHKTYDQIIPDHSSHTTVLSVVNEIPDKNDDKILAEGDNDIILSTFPTEIVPIVPKKNVTIIESTEAKTANISIFVIIGIITLTLIIGVIYCLFICFCKKKKRDFDPEGRPTFQPNRFTLVLEDNETKIINENFEEATFLVKYDGLDQPDCLIPNFNQPVKSSL